MVLSVFFLSQNTAQTRSISPRSVGDMLLLKLIERFEKCFDLTENPDVRKDSLSSENVEKIRGKQQLESLQRIRNVDDKQGPRRGWGWGGFPTFWLIKSLFFSFRKPGLSFTKTVHISY